jgi:hypothetical protein
MKKNIKYLIIGIITVSSFTGLFIFNFMILPNLQSNIYQSNNPSREAKFEVLNITVSIDYSGVQVNELFQNINLTNFETTALDALANCCVIRVANFNGRLLVEEINGVGVGWIYWINNDPPPNIPANYFNLLDNDTINWKFVS